MVSANSFQVVTYNILAKSLATNTIPWVMTVSPSIQERIERYSSQNFQDWVSSTLQPEYLRHFHKNFESGDYTAMRGFWGARKCTSPHDIPPELTGLTWVGDDQVMYGQDAIVATTLRGVAKKSLPRDLFDDFFQQVVSAEEQLYAWPKRGPRVFAAITNNKPDIAALMEYDCHFSLAEYRKQGWSETFSDAMAALGYDGAFFKDPLKGRDPPSGLGLFWQSSVFESVTTKKDAPAHGISVLECDQEALGGSTLNADLKEYWHSKKQPLDGPATLMPAADRRNAALARLLHKPSGKTVACCATHLMTTSRDGTKTNWYPGEVRAGEMAELKKLCKSQLEANDAVLLMGDFNTNANEVESVFGGGGITCADNSCLSKLSLDTGFDVDTRTLKWNSHVLREAFADVHQWGDGVGKGGCCTSYNAVRVEWIDYIWHCSGLRPTQRSGCSTPKGPIPDEEHPSDHLPLCATFEFV